MARNLLRSAVLGSLQCHVVKQKPLQRSTVYGLLGIHGKSVLGVPFPSEFGKRPHHTSSKDFIFRQLFDHRTYTYTYILGDKSSRDALIIDPVIELVQRDVAIIKELGLNLLYGINTHVHADHISGTGMLKKVVPACKSVIAEKTRATADIHVNHHDKINFGQFELECRATPGHTNGCMTYVLHSEGLVFTGDALLIRGCGRTDFQEGSSTTLYESVHSQILSLPSDFFLYPAHDYTGQSVSTVEEELKWNRRLTKSKDEFQTIMDELNLPYPKQIDTALPANMVCGLQKPPSEEGSK